MVDVVNLVNLNCLPIRTRARARGRHERCELEVNQVHQAS
jgi:hypothetical protein